MPHDIALRPTLLDYSKSPGSNHDWSLIWVTKLSRQYKEKCIKYTFLTYFLEVLEFLFGGGDSGF